MSPVLLFAIAALLPTAAMCAILGSVGAARRVSEARSRAHPPPAEPIERLGSRLRRLRAELEAASCR